MKDLIFLVFQLLTTMVKLNRPGGGRAVIAEKAKVSTAVFTQRRT
jgi:hypothetical protein